LPELVGAPLSVGQSSTISSLLMAMGGTGFVMAEKAAEMVATGRFKYIADVPALDQPVFAAMHLRHRVSKAHRKLTRVLYRRFGRGDAARA